MTRIDRLRPGALVLSIALLLSACATQAPRPSAPSGPSGEPAAQEPVLTPQMASDAQLLTKMAAMQDRLYRVAAPLLINNAELCKSNARNLLGFTAKNRYYYPGTFNEAAHIAFGMGEQLQVSSVLAGSGAARAGLRSGDVLVAAGDKPLPSGPDASATAGAVLGPLVASQSTLPMSIERDGKPRQLTIPVTRACAFGIELGNADNINSYADGTRVMVTRGMIGFTQDDDELAYLVAKGMAHNMLGHAGTQRNAATIGSIIDNLARVTPDTSMLIGSGGIKAMPADLDTAADRLSLYLLVRAGYDINGVAAFWKRLHDSYPPTILNGYTASHPATGARVATLERTVAEIKTKRAAKKALVP